MKPLEVKVGSHEGVRPGRIAECLEKYYRTEDGRRVKATVGHGEFVNGIPLGLILLEAVDA